MSLQFLKYGIGTRAAKAAGWVLAVLTMAAVASAQVATRTHLAVSTEGRQATLTAKVADVAGNPASDGTVSFETAKGSVGSAFVENGSATLLLDKLPKGTRTVTAVYSGSEGYAASAASANADPNASTLPDFDLTASPTTLSLSPGQFGTILVTVTPENGFNDMVTLSCSGQPTVTVKCVFSPTTLTPLTTAAASSTLQIQTQAASGTSTMLGKPPSTVALAIVLPGILALVGLGTLRKRSGIGALRVIGLLALLTASGLGLGACSARYGYLNHPPSGNPGTAAGTYTITLSGYASINGTSVTGHSLNVTMTVK